MSLTAVDHPEDKQVIQVRIRVTAAKVDRDKTNFTETRQH